jgi:hypothetical protein
MEADRYYLMRLSELTKLLQANDRFGEAGTAGSAHDSDLSCVRARHSLRDLAIVRYVVLFRRKLAPPVPLWRPDLLHRGSGVS